MLGFVRISKLKNKSVFSISQVFSGFPFPVFFLFFLFLSYQSAIGQANRRRAERLELSANRYARTFPNVKFCEAFSVLQTIGKYDEAGNIARLNHKFALSVSFDDLLNRSRNFYDRIDKF
jgi:hypothetical protein